MKNIHLTIIAGIIIIVTGVIVIYPQIMPTLQNPFEPKYVEVSNIVIKYLPQAFFQPQPQIQFTVKNLVNINTNVVGIEIDGKQYGIKNIGLPPGQTLQPTYFLNNFTVISQHTYNIKLTFTMNDGKYQTFTSSYTIPAFRRSSQLKINSFAMTPYQIYLGITIMNTGDLPIKGATYSVDNKFKRIWPLEDFIKSGDSYPLNAFNVGNLVKGKSYEVTVIVSYSDGSTDTITGSFTY